MEKERKVKGLSHREEQVLELAVAGRSASEIAAQLGITRRVAQKYLQRVYEYAGTGVHTRERLAKWYKWKQAEGK
jgi:DNA-binding CsgD family transcriptional regulator